MRVWAVLLLVATAAADPFTPPRQQFFGGATDAYGRYLESLALCKAALEKDPTGVLALERAIDLLDRFRVSDALTDRVRAALRHADLEPAHRAALRGLLGRLLVQEAAGLGGGVRVVVIGPGGVVQTQDRELTAEARKLFTEAVPHLRAAIGADAKAARARNDLAQALGALDAVANAAEVTRLRTEASALTLRPVVARPEPERTDRLAVDLRLQAERLEQKPTDPDHTGALLLRKRALVLDYCTHTIPFAYEAPLYGPVSLLADVRLVRVNLTRSYVTGKGDVDRVAPRYYPATAKRRREIVQGLAQDRSANGAAVLLRLVARAQPNDTLADLAQEVLAQGRHAAVPGHLPRLLDTALLLGDVQHYTPRGERMLVSLAATLGVADAAPVLAKYLDLDTNLDQPRDIAAALGRIGRPSDAAALLALARDPRKDVYFRRQAIRALGRIEGARLEDVPAEPYLELALAAARYGREPSESLRGRILTGLDHFHEADDAARYCVELGLREALPLIDGFLARYKDHYAKEQLTAARAALR
jgi:tetratricopeptide (TPR) repeat protein